MQDRSHTGLGLSPGFHFCLEEQAMQMLKKLWADETGAIISAELILVVTILVLGMVVGLTTLRDQVTQELGDVALAIASINQSFSFSGATGHHSSSAGSIFIDLLDECDGIDSAACEPACIDVCGIEPAGEG
jgi:Flp pilus assembly pilin Flp